jgi:7,8-dihydropterin-6-yl-methyl-4-(beta-D-ribofuranosyl)aminobenzene 5'-phosphate synthase
MRIIIIYDNMACNPNLTADLRCSCLVKTGDHTLLFDTGANGSILMDNMARLDIDPEAIDGIFTSHGHGYHVDIEGFDGSSTSHCELLHNRL